MSIQHLEQSHVDLSKIPPLESNRLIGFVNHFALNIAQQINNLMEVADQRLHQIHCKIGVCKTNLLILERKLNSVPGLASVPPPPPKTIENTETNAIRTTEKDEQPRQEPQQLNQEVPSTSSTESGQQLNMNSSQNETPDEQPSQTVSDNPELQKYYKMLKVGVPLPAVKIKMSAEGLDPDLLKV